MDAALLSGPYAQGLAVLDIAHRVGLGVFQGNQGQQHVIFGPLGQVLVLGDEIGQHGFINGQIVVPLLKRDAEDVPPLNGGGGVIRVDFHHVVPALALGLQDLQSFRGVVRGDDAVGHLQGQEAGGVPVAGVG